MSYRSKATIGLTLIAIFASLTCCGTTLETSGRARASKDKPSGIVVNRRLIAPATITFSGPALGDAPPQTRAFNGVHPTRTLVLNVSRMPFASGKLTLELDDRQVLTSVGIESTPGTQGAITVLSEALDAREKIREARRAEKAAADDGQ